MCDKVSRNIWNKVRFNKEKKFEIYFSILPITSYNCNNKKKAVDPSLRMEVQKNFHRNENNFYVEKENGSALRYEINETPLLISVGRFSTTRRLCKAPLPSCIVTPFGLSRLHTVSTIIDTRWSRRATPPRFGSRDNVAAARRVPLFFLFGSFSGSLSRFWGREQRERFSSGT